MGQKNGFTLIELLVVIAIIAILAAILFPIFISVKQKSNETKCSSNLRQVGVATAMYMDDYSNRYPRYSLVGHPRRGDWYTLVQKYAKTKLLTRCPSDTYYPSTTQYPYGDKRAPSYHRNAYTNYWSGFYPVDSPQDRASPQESVIRFKMTTVYLMDGSAYGSIDEAQHNWWGPPTSWRTDPPLKEAEIRHSGGANVLFCDWHVKLVRPREWRTDSTDASNDPLTGLYSVPTGKWRFKGDGRHPWFRGD